MRFGCRDRALTLPRPIRSTGASHGPAWPAPSGATGVAVVTCLVESASSRPSLSKSDPHRPRALRRSSPRWPGCVLVEFLRPLVRCVHRALVKRGGAGIHGAGPGDLRGMCRLVGHASSGRPLRLLAPVGVTRLASLTPRLALALRSGAVPQRATTRDGSSSPGPIHPRRVRLDLHADACG